MLILLSSLRGGSIASANWQLESGHHEPAVIPLEIIAPRAGLTTTNRYYKTYTGIPYRVPVGILGGDGPYHCTLTTAPSGMTVSKRKRTGGQDYWVIEWTNPVESGSPHNITLRVQDQEGGDVSVSYTLTVDTSNALFLDSVSGSDANSGTSPASRKQTIDGWYKGLKTDSTYANFFIYYYTGTYYTADAPIEDGVRMACTGGNKPQAHIGIDGESPVLDLTDSYWINYSNSVGYWWSGFRITNVGSSANKGIQWDSGVNNIVIFENDIEEPVTGTGTNASIFFSASNTLTQYLAMIGNIFEGTNNKDAFLVYSANKGVIDGNILNNNTGANGWGFYLKDNFSTWSIRSNTGLSALNAKPLVRIDTYSTASDIDIIFNNYKTSGQAVQLGFEAGPVSGIHDRRNTWQTPHNKSQGVASGDWNATRNVVVHDGVYTEGYRIQSGAVTITRTELLAATSGLIDPATGLLTGADRDTYLGIRGHEID